MKPNQFIQITSTGLKDRVDEYAQHCLCTEINEGGQIKEIRGLIYDEENTGPITELIEIVEKSRHGAGVYGNTGSGKTLIFQLLQRVIRPEHPRSFMLVETNDLAKAFSNTKIGWDVFKRFQDKHVVFNDLGFEPKGKFYKDYCEVMEHFIFERELLFDHKQLRTYYTTNLDDEEILKRYGQRTASRLSKLCHKIYLGETQNSKDRRSLKNMMGFPPVYHQVHKSQEELDWERKYAAGKIHAANNPYKSQVHNLGSIANRMKEKFDVSPEKMRAAEIDLVRIKINKILEITITNPELTDFNNELDKLFRNTDPTQPMNTLKALFVNRFTPNSEMQYTLSPLEEKIQSIIQS